MGDRPLLELLSTSEPDGDSHVILSFPTHINAVQAIAVACTEAPFVLVFHLPPHSSLHTTHHRVLKRLYQCYHLNPISNKC